MEKCINQHTHVSMRFIQLSDSDLYHFLFKKKPRTHIDYVLTTIDDVDWTIRLHYIFSICHIRKNAAKKLNVFHPS